MKTFKVGDILTKKNCINSLEAFKNAQERVGRNPNCSELTYESYEYYQKFHYVKKIRIREILDKKHTVFPKSKMIIFIKIIDYDKNFLSEEELSFLESHYYPIEFFDGLTEKLDKILKV